MERIDRIARRVAATEAVVASFFFAKERPPDLFAGTFFDVRKKAKALKEKWEDQAVASMTQTLATDLTGSGLNIVSFKISLGKYRGSRFVTSAKLKVVTGTQAKADKLLTHLQTKYSPKYKLKGFNEETGEADYNVR
jgi:hypothetical protein